MQQKYFQNYFVAENSNEITVNMEEEDISVNGIKTNVPLNNFLNAQVSFLLINFFLTIYYILYIIFYMLLFYYFINFIIL